MSRSEDPIIVRAELSELDAAVTRDLLAMLVISCRHRASTVRGWTMYVRSGGCGCLECMIARRLDDLGLLD